MTEAGPSATLPLPLGALAFSPGDDGTGALPQGVLHAALMGAVPQEESGNPRRETSPSAKKPTLPIAGAP
jgi:hypothetical protein